MANRKFREAVNINQLMEKMIDSGKIRDEITSFIKNVMSTKSKENREVGVDATSREHDRIVDISRYITSLYITN